MSRGCVTKLAGQIESQENIPRRQPALLLNELINFDAIGSVGGVQVFVVFDSNVWVSQVGLKSDRAVKVLEFFRSRNAILAVPEIVRHEMEIKLREILLSKRQTIEGAIGYIAKVHADVENIALPTRDDIKERVGNLVNGTGLQIREMPMTMEAAKSSLDKILRKQKPSDKREQFTDGVIWANCVELLKESDVWLVSEDPDFHKNRNDPNQGLASNLECEAAKCPNKLRFFADLERLRQFVNNLGIPPDMRQGVPEDVRRVSPGDDLDDAKRNESEYELPDETSWRSGQER